MKKKSLTLGFALVLLATGAMAQTVPLEIEAGYRWLSLSGNRDMYRTQIDEQNGFLIRSLTFSSTDLGGFADHLRLDASDLGVGPAGSLRLDFGKTSLYRFTLAYRQTNAFSALPEFANPLLGAGVIPGQHTYDRNRRMLDADFEFQKWSSITPFVGISYNRYSGPGTTTYHFGQDEFLLDQSLNNRDEELRGGFDFNYKNFAGSVTQGWRNYRDRETFTLAPGAGSGNNLAPVLGTPISASSITRDDSSNGHTPFTSAYVTGQFSRARVTGNFVRFSSTLSGNDDESAAGDFASFALSRFFTGYNDTVASNSKNNTWRGGARAEISLTEKVDLFAGFQREHRSLEGTELADYLYLASIPFGGTNPTDLTAVLNAKSSLDRTEDLLNAAVSARSLGPFAVRVGVSQSRQEVTVSPDLSEIVVPGPSQGGTFDRHVNSFDATGSFAKHGFSADASWWHDSANDPIMRTDFISRNRYRLRGGWATADNRFRAQLIAEDSNPKNDRTGFNYDARIRTYTAHLEAAPTEVIRVYAEGARFRTNSSILYRLPQNFDLATSYNQERGNSWTGGLLLTFKPVTFDTSYMRFDNSGTNPFTIDRYRLRGTFKLVGNTGLAAEWNRDKYEEALSFGNFNANRYGIYLRWTP